MTTASRSSSSPIPPPPAIPGDRLRAAIWRFAGDRALEEAIRAARRIARGPVAGVAGGGARRAAEWSAEKGGLVDLLAEAGLLNVGLDPDRGGPATARSHLALALAAFELAAVDTGAAITVLAAHLALAPILARGTAEQRGRYLPAAAPAPDARRAAPARGAFCLTEPIPFAGAKRGPLGGRVRIADWPAEGEPILQVDKRGRFTSNMDFAEFVVAAVDSADPRIAGSCMVILEQGDPGTYDRGPATRKLVGRLHSTRDPIFSLRVPASRIVGGYSVRDGVVVPACDHIALADHVLREQAPVAGALTAAKLLAAVPSVLRYQRARYHEGGAAGPAPDAAGRGLQEDEDAVHRLVDVWAAAEAGASLAFAAARLLDAFAPIARRTEQIFVELGITTPAGRRQALLAAGDAARDLLALSARSATEGADAERLERLGADPLVQYLVTEAAAAVLAPAAKLWNTTVAAAQLREALSLVGGAAVLEDAPGDLAHKWLDTQIEAIWGGPEAVQRNQIAAAMGNELFLAQFRQWIDALRGIAATRPQTGACALASAMALWLWTLRHLMRAKDAAGRPLFTSHRQSVTFSLADALGWLLAARAQLLDLFEPAQPGVAEPASQEPGLAETTALLGDLCHVQAGRAAGEVGRICAELVFGYNRHPSWTEDGGLCYAESELDALEGAIPGLAAGGWASGDVLLPRADAPRKAGPCVRFAGLESFGRLRAKLDGCITGARLARDRAAARVRQLSLAAAD